MKTNVIFLNCLLRTAAAFNQFFEPIGVFTEEKSTLQFFENDIDVYMSRHYVSPCSNLDRMQFSGLDFCPTKTARKNFDESFDQLEKSCEEMWNGAVQNLTKVLFPVTQGPPSAQAIVDDINLWTPGRKKRDYDFESMKLVDNEFSQRYATGTARERRSLSAVVTGIGLFSSLVSSLTTGFSSIYHFFQVRKQNQKMYLKQKDSNLACAAIAENTVQDIKTVADALCDESFHSNLLISKMYVNMILRENVRELENEILNFNFGTIPKTSSFLNTLLELCTSIEPNQPDFCKHLIFSGGVNIEFDGLTIHSGFIIGLLRINIPIQSVLFIKNTHYEVINLGSYIQSKYFIVDVPQDIIVDGDGTFYSLNKGLCSGLVCSINSVMVTETARCLRSIVSNQTQFCTTIYMNAPRDCAFRKVNQGTIIRASSGVFFPTGTTPFGAISLTKRAIFTSSQGRLLCQNNGYNTTHIISPGHILLKNSTAVLIEPKVTINKNFNITKTEFMLSETLQLAKKIKNLYEIDDTINIQGKERPIVLTIILISTTIMVSCFLIYFAFINREHLHNYTLSTISLLRGLNEKKESKNKKLADTENSEESPLTLINDGQKAVYPKLPDGLENNA